MTMSPRNPKLGLVVAYNPDRWVLWIPQGHPQEHPQGCPWNNIKLNSNHRQPILRFLSLAGSGYRMDQAWLWLRSGKARLDLVGFGIRLDQV
jgi:hypothetical protein